MSCGEEKGETASREKKLCKLSMKAAKMNCLSTRSSEKWIVLCVRKNAIKMSEMIRIWLFFLFNQTSTPLKNVLVKKYFFSSAAMRACSSIFAVLCQSSQCGQEFIVCLISSQKNNTYAHTHSKNLYRFSFFSHSTFTQSYARQATSSTTTALLQIYIT